MSPFYSGSLTPIDCFDNCPFPPQDRRQAMADSLSNCSSLTGGSSLIVRYVFSRDALSVPTTQIDNLGRRSVSRSHSLSPHSYALVVIKSASPTRKTPLTSLQTDSGIRNPPTIHAGRTAFCSPQPPKSTHPLLPGYSREWRRQVASTSSRTCSPRLLGRTPPPPRVRTKQRHTEQSHLSGLITPPIQKVSAYDFA